VKKDTVTTPYGIILHKHTNRLPAKGKMGKQKGKKCRTESKKTILQGNGNCRVEETYVVREKGGMNTRRKEKKGG